MAKDFPAALLAIGLCALLGATASAQGPGCATCGQSVKGPCPPHYRHFAEGPPKLKFRHACPRPVCDPCNLEHYGYYPTCWQPWAFGPNYGHCPAPHSGTVLPPPAQPPYAPRVIVPERPAARQPQVAPKPPRDSLPPPRKLDDSPSARLMFRSR